MPGLSTVVVIFLGLLLAITATEAAVEGKGLCKDAEVVFVVFTDTDQVLGAKSKPATKRMVLSASRDYTPDDINNLPDEYYFCLIKAEGTDNYYLAPNMDGQNLVVEIAQTNGRVTLWKKSPKGVKDQQTWELVVNEEFDAKPLSQCFSLKAVFPKYKGHKLGTTNLKSEDSTVQLSSVADDTEDPTQTFNLLQVN